MARFSAPPPSARPARPPCRPRSAGASPIAHRVAARHADVYLTRGEPPDQVAQQIATVRRLAEAQGRTVRFGIRLHLVVRETTARARDAANDLIRYVDEDAIARAQVTLGSTQAVGQQRMIALHGGRRDALEVSPNLWAGVGLVRGGAGTALVGDADTVAARMEEYAALGTAELLFPKLPREFFRQGEDWPARSSTPSGEFAPERLALVRR